MTIDVFALGLAIGFVAGWLFAGLIVLRMALRSDGSAGPVGLDDIVVMIGGVIVWPYLLFAEGEDD